MLGRSVQTVLAALSARSYTAFLELGENSYVVGKGLLVGLT